MYFERFLECITNTEISIHEDITKIHSIHPEEIIANKDTVIQEVSSFKLNIKNTINKAIIVFQELSKKFQQIAFSLSKRNEKWFQNAKSFDINKKNLKGFKYEMYNYRVGAQRIESTIPPKFDSVDMQDLAGNGTIFKQKYFKDLYMKEEDGSEDISKNYFRGGSKKIEINEHEIPQMFRFALSWLQRYDAIVKNIISQNDEINKVMSRQQKTIITESTVLNESIFKDEYYDILLEEALEPTDIKAEEKSQSNVVNGISTNTEENKKNKEINNMNEAINVYWKTCSTIQTMKMNVCEEIYKAFVDFIDRVMK